MNHQTYFAVIFSSKLKLENSEGYEEMAQRMIDLAKKQNGFLGVESARGEDGFGVTVSYWRSLEDILAWKVNSEHLIAQKIGHDRWYDSYCIRICKVENERHVEI